MTKDVMASAHENPQPTPELFAKYQAYLSQRQQAVATMQDQPWQLQEPPAFENYEDFAEHWEHYVSPLMKADFARYLEGGWEKVRQEVEGLVGASREGTEHLMNVAVEPTPELYAKYVAYWTASNNSDVAEELNAPSMRIEPFEHFVMMWVKLQPDAQREMAQWYEDGYEATYQKGMQSAEEALREYEENPEVRQRVQAEVETALGKALGQ